MYINTNTKLISEILNACFLKIVFKDLIITKLVFNKLKFYSNLAVFFKFHTTKVGLTLTMC